jgi:hypothetical protein
MPERLVDVEKQGSKVLHTFPVTISAPAVEEEAFKEKALEAAGNAKLVPNEELESLNAKMHVSRGGQLTPYGDPHGVLAETKAGLDQVVRERAYLLWEQAGRRMAAPTTSGIKRSISASANAPTHCGSGKVVRKARRTSTGCGSAPLKRSDFVAMDGWGLHRAGRACWPTPPPRPWAACGSERGQPVAQRALALWRRPQDRDGAQHQKPSDIPIALLGYRPESLLAAGRVLLGSRAKPGGEIAAGFEGLADLARWPESPKRRARRHRGRSPPAG